MPSDLEQSMLGRMVGDYQIVSMLGEGGMGVVFKGVHVTLGQTVAIKMLQPELMKNDSVRNRFVREAQALARLNHPNMVSLFNFLDHEDGCFIIMEFTEGKDIEKHMEETGLIPPEVCCEWFEQVLSAMGYAHSLNIIHRDIKPSNIMVTSAGPVKVLDFGTAKLLDAPALTKAGMTLGTVIYMSPEQLLGKTIDARSDIYSLGVTLYEMCTGRLPFEDAREIELVKKIARADPTPPTTHYPYLPKRLEEIILKAMAKKPEDRFQTAEEFLADIRAFKAELRGAAYGQPMSAAAAAPVATTAHQHVAPQVMPGADSAVTPAAVGASAAAGAGSKLFFGLAAGILVLAILAGVGLSFVSVVVGALVGGLLFVVAVAVGIVGVVKGGGGSSVGAPSGQPMVAGQPVGGFVPPVAAPVAGSALGFLVVMEGQDKGQRYPLTPSGVTIGRGEENVIALNDPGVSTVHAQVVQQGSQWVLQDLGSRNGCYVNNQKVTHHTLANNDIIVMGNTMFMVNLS